MSVCIFYQKHPKLPYNSLTFEFYILVFFRHFPIVSCTEPQWPEKGGFLSYLFIGHLPWLFPLW